jgi:hypothetical protein
MKNGLKTRIGQKIVVFETFSEPFAVEAVVDKSHLSIIKYKHWTIGVKHLDIVTVPPELLCFKLL